MKPSTSIAVTTQEIEVAVAKYFNFRTNIIVPNAWWGVGLNHECDLLVLTQSDYAYEVEIKVSKSDLLADLKKPHLHKHKKIKRLYFAIPLSLKDYCANIPDHAGVLVVENAGPRTKVSEIRPAKNSGNYKWSQKERYELSRIGSMRTFDLKNKLNAVRAKSKIYNTFGLTHENVIAYLEQCDNHESLINIEKYLAAAKNKMSLKSNGVIDNKSENCLSPKELYA